MAASSRVETKFKLLTLSGQRLSTDKVIVARRPNRHRCCRQSRRTPSRRRIDFTGISCGASYGGGKVRGTLREGAAIAVLVLAGVALGGCSKKNDNAADTTAAMSTADTSTMSASSTTPVMQDTATTAATTTSTTKKSSTKKTAAKKA